jgi:predicted MFS family arabinose efflux permease
MRGAYALLAGVLMVLGLAGTLTPALVFPIVALSGLIRPSDLGMRQALIGDTMPGQLLMNAMGLSRMTMDLARIAGALAGASLFALLGLGYSYVFVTGFYLASFALTLGVSRGAAAGAAGAAGAPGALGAPASGSRSSSSAHLSDGWRDLKEGLVYVWNSPRVLAMMWLAFFINMTAFPLSSGLLPYVARNIYGVNEIGLGHLVASFAVGALIGSILMTLTGGARNPPRFMMINIFLWYAAVMAFALFETKAAGMVVLVFIGLFQSASMITMAVVLLNAAGEQFRARVMGVRMLAIYGMPIGLLAGGVLIDAIRFTGTISVFFGIGTLTTLLIGYRWRRVIWQ